MGMSAVDTHVPLGSQQATELSQCSPWLAPPDLLEEAVR